MQEDFKTSQQTYYPFNINEYLAQCTKCKYLTGIIIDNNDELNGTIKFKKVGDKIFHICGGEVKLFNNA